MPVILAAFLRFRRRLGERALPNAAKAKNCGDAGRLCRQR